jgi:hypothetical protein
MVVLMTNNNNTCREGPTNDREGETDDREGSER